MSKIKISLTDFVDFVSKTGSTKLTKVKDVKNRKKYHPMFDFWKILRDEIITYHQENKTNKNELDKVTIQLKDKKKVTRYLDLIRGYKKFLGRKKMTWLGVSSKKWLNNTLEVRINPELGLEINGQSYIIKLYFKADKLSKSKVSTILLLLEEMYKKEIQKGYEVAILDINNSRLITSNSNNNLMPLLAGEANSFETIWNGI